MAQPRGREKDVQVSAEPGIGEALLEKVVSCNNFKNWVANVENDRKLFIGHIHIQDVDMFGPRVGFIKFKARALVDIGVSDKSGKREDGEDGVIEVPGIVFMRGGSVYIASV